MITTKDHKDDIISQRALDYTPDGQIKSIKDNDKLIATYQYNHLRQRISKTIYQKDNQTNQTKEETTQYLWDKGLLSAEIKDDKVIRRYVYLDIMPVAVLDYGYDEKGKLNETKVYSIHTDHLGTPKAITNKNQETVWQIDLDTFGETKSIQSKDNFQFNLRFAGQYFDQETGYHYNYHRYYNPKVGRYLTSDPIGLAGGFNSYGYAYNRPMEFVDPLGLLVEVYFMNPVTNGYAGSSHSMFGHFAYRINDHEFTFNPSNNLVEQSGYIKNQQGKRDMVGMRLNLTKQQEELLLNNTYAVQKTAKYINGVYMCANPFQEAMRMTGIDLYRSKFIVSPSPSVTSVSQPILAPEALYDRMIRMESLVKHIIVYDNVNYEFMGVKGLSPDFIKKADGYKGNIKKDYVYSWKK